MGAVREPAYSPTWFRCFGDAVAPERTEREVAFLVACLPLETFPRLLDVCCGSGRHAVALARRGYRVVGVERDPAAGARARAAAAGSSAQFVQGDVADLASLGAEQFDAALCLWQSFGWGDDVAHVKALRKIGARLREGGLFVLDVYDGARFDRIARERTLDLPAGPVLESVTFRGDRLRVELTYGWSADRDVFDWRIWTAEELAALAGRAGFALVEVHRDFGTPAPQGAPRMQLLLQRPTRSA